MHASLSLNPPRTHSFARIYQAIHSNYGTVTAESKGPKRGGNTDVSLGHATPTSRSSPVGGHGVGTSGTLEREAGGGREKELLDWPSSAVPRGWGREIVGVVASVLSMQREEEQDGHYRAITCQVRDMFDAY